MKKTSYFGNPWIGMFARANDSVAIIPPDAPEKFEMAIAESLGVRTIKSFIASTNILGMYVAMNNNGIILPSIAQEEEVQALKKEGLNVHLVKDPHNACGNLFCLNDKGGVATERMERSEITRLSDVLGIEIVSHPIYEFQTPGSACIATNKGFLVHYKALEEDVKMLESILKVKGDRGTLNTGVGFIGFGMVANSKGYVVGEATTAFEQGKVEQALGFI